MIAGLDVSFYSALCQIGLGCFDSALVVQPGLQALGILRRWDFRLVHPGLFSSADVGNTPVAADRYLFSLSFGYHF